MQFMFSFKYVNVAVNNFKYKNARKHSNKVFSTVV